MKRTVLIALCIFGGMAVDVSADHATLSRRQQQLDQALEKVQPALVSVQDGFGAGSGVVVSGDGIVLTASHVVDTRRRQRPRLRVVFPDGTEYRATLLGMNRSDDAAMLKITEQPRNGTRFPHVELGESEKVSRGDWCFALGHPGGFRPDRPAPVRLGRVLSVGYRTIVSDCAIVLGDSGGPLFDMSGKVIGIHSMITEVIVENRHVAIDCFRRDGDRMENGESWGRLQAHDSELAETSFVGLAIRWRNFTPEISQVVSNGPAASAGIRAGDILLRVAGQPFADPLGLSNLLEQLAEEQTVDVVVDRHGKEVTISMTTGRKPTDSELRERQDQGIEAADREHYLELRNQLTSLRRVGPFEKRSPEELQRFESVLDAARNSVVEFRKYGQTVTLGTIMSEDGYILTKASELDNVPRSVCVLPDGRTLKPREVAVDYAFDLMLVKVDARDLNPVPWTTEEQSPGRIVITTDSRGAPLLPGVVSVATRKLPTSTRGFLGVQLQQLKDGIGQNAGVAVERVLPGGAAMRFGIREDDVIRSINGESLSDVRRMMDRIRQFEPNARIALQIERGDTVRTVDVVLTPRFIEDHGDVMLSRYSDTDKLGKFASTHNSGFPEALQHDTDLYPHQCGGPLFDISGRAVGLNIARAARITSYAVPASAVKKVFEQLRAQDEQRLPLKKAS
ncbi:MAG: trypsin-like peptidase domain-containing protein [Fuerstiella sp.]